MTKRKRKRSKPRQTQTGKPLRAVILKQDADTLEPGQRVNRVTLDNTLPGGFRMEPGDYR